MVWLLVAQAAAAEWGRVTGLAETDPGGRRRPVASTPRAVVVRGGVEAPLAVGDLLEEGDVVRTTAARVAVLRPDRERVWISEGTELALVEARSVLQELGDVYYRLRDLFDVSGGEVAGAVEGTQFLVHVDSPAAPVRVAVTAGVVAVANPDDRASVPRGREVTAPQRGDVPDPTRIGGRARQAVFEHAWLLGRPRLEVGGLGSVGADRRAVGLSAFARAPLAPGARLVAELGIDDNAGDPGLRVPASVGLAIGPRALHAVGRLDEDLEVKVCDCVFPEEAGRRVLLHLGGTAAAHTTWPLTRAVTFEGEVRAGWVGAFEADVRVGLGVGL